MGKPITLGMMQPYFFPYLGYFKLINDCSSWIVFDEAQYVSKTWINRNRILHPRHSWMYISVPLTKPTIRLHIKEIKIENKDATLKSLLGKISHYKGKAPFYKATKQLIENVFSSTRSERLVDLNLSTLSATCNYLQIPFEYILSSEINFLRYTNMKPDDWSLEACKHLGCQRYLNAPGGRSFFSATKFLRHGIDLAFVEYSPIRYEVVGYDFEEDLSILDVLMWNSPERINYFLEKSARKR